MAWKYNPDEFNPNVSFEVVPVGDHRVRIEEVEQQVSKNTGNEMLKITFYFRARREVVVLHCVYAR